MQSQNLKPKGDSNTPSSAGGEGDGTHSPNPCHQARKEQASKPRTTPSDEQVEASVTKHAPEAVADYTPPGIVVIERWVPLELFQQEESFDILKTELVAAKCNNYANLASLTAC